jgi:cyanobactin maturation PatA/PatG family protease
MEIPGLKELWDQTLGDPRVCIAVLDGPVDLSHPSLAGANLVQLETLVSTSANRGPALVHGTHVASVIFGQHNGPIKGIAPGCRGLVVPIFSDGVNGSIAPCSQLDLARAITQAAQAGAHIINISGGELSVSGTAHPLLADTIQNCADNNILIVAAVGNDGCACLHVPGALPSVLAVGAMDAEGLPLDFSNWGESYQTQGILAPGENVLGAKPEGGTITNSGTSYATPLVSGIAALLLDIQLKREQRPNSHAIREAILSSAVGCDEQPISDCRRLLTGRLSVEGAMSQIINRGDDTVSHLTETTENNTSQIIENSDSRAPLTQTLLANVQAAAASEAVPQSPTVNPAIAQGIKNPTSQHSVGSGNIRATTCETCGGGGAPSQLVFALGQLGYDFGTEARRDSIMQHMDEPTNPYDPHQFLAYLEKNPWDAAAILWTLNLDATPIYAIQAQSAFAQEISQRLRQFLGEQTRGEVERVSIPGYIAGSARLSNGQVVPVIWPDLRGMYSWNTEALVSVVCGAPPAEEAQQKEKDDYAEKAKAVKNFLQRVYEELRNLGTAPQDRAINYAATNASQAAAVFREAIKVEMDLDTIEVERSPICRPESDCWDVKLTFFNPSKVFEQARKVYLFSVDVGDVVPVMVSPVRSWFVR